MMNQNLSTPMRTLTLRVLGKLVFLSLVCCGCSFEKLNFSLDKGRIDPTSTTASDAMKIAPLAVPK